MASYPSTLLPAPRSAGYGIDPTDMTARTEMDAGNVVARRRTYHQRDVVNVAWTFSDRQMAIFRAWFHSADGANGGAGWFDMVLLDGWYGKESRNCRFASNWQAKYVPHLYWEVTATIEMRNVVYTARQLENLMLGIMEQDVVLLWAPTTQADVLVSKIGPDAEFAVAGAQYDESGTSLGAVAALHSKGVWVGPGYQNLLTYSERFDNGAWVKGRTAIAAANSAAAPDGTLTADIISDDTGTLGTHRIYQAAETGVSTYTCSVFVKAGTVSVVRLSLTNQVETGRAYADFDIINGAVLSGSGGIESVGDGWYRISVTGATITGDTSAALFLYIANAAGAFTYTSSGESTIYAWGAQLTQTIAPMPYVKTEASPVSVAPAAGSTTNGLAWAMSAEMTAALSGACTVAAEVTMGISSADTLGNTAQRNVITCTDAANGLSFYRGDSVEANSVRASAYDGTAYTGSASGVWSRNERHIEVVQTNSAAPQFRVGNQRIGVDSAIQWGSWATYDGSFNPLTYLRAAYGNTVPLWLKKVMVSNLGGLTDAQITERLNA